jgi:hypothetical protein
MSADGVPLDWAGYGGGGLNQSKESESRSSVVLDACLLLLVW